jgi:hypothetical protein
MTEPTTRADREAHRRWCHCLTEIRAGYFELLQAQTPGEAWIARERMQAAARRIDRIDLPKHWRSWQHLGDAVHGSQRAPAPGATQEG